MPTLSMFYGIVVKMYSEQNSKHKVPHIHAEYQGHEAVFDLQGNLIENGGLPAKKIHLVTAWCTIHEEDLVADWGLLSTGQGFFKIPPLQ